MSNNLKLLSSEQAKRILPVFDIYRSVTLSF